MIRIRFFGPGELIQNGLGTAKYEEAAQRVILCAALSRTQMCLTFYELHQESFHCHQDVLDEEDDGCHFWYCQEGIGASRSSPDSR